MLHFVLFYVAAVGVGSYAALAAIKGGDTRILVSFTLAEMFGIVAGILLCHTAVVG